MRFNPVRNKQKFKERYEKFISKFLELNEEVLNDINSGYNECEKIPCHKIILSGDGSKELVLPDGYETIDILGSASNSEDATYILDKSYKVVCGISLTNNDPYPKNKIAIYKEHILERASIITEDYFGDSKEDYLKEAILKMIDGNYSYFTKYDNTRFKLVLISRSNIPRIMISTLKRNDIRGNYSSLNSVTDLYVNYIKNKVNSNKMDNNITYVKSMK